MGLDKEYKDFIRTGVILLVSLAACATMAVYLTASYVEPKRQEQTEVETQLEELIELNEQLLKDNERLYEENEQLHNLLEELIEQLEPLQELEITKATITNYAPLDPNAVEGMCYSGDPNTTASGAPVTIGRTVAADPSIPFGTRVWIEGYGWRVVEDRGGAIRGNKFDVAIHCRTTAFNRGPHERWVIIDWR